MRLLLLFVMSCYVFSAKAQYLDSTEIAEVNATSSAAEGDLYLDTIRGQYYIGLPNGRVSRLGAGESWSLNGNSSVSTSQFLGSLNDVALKLKSNNTIGLSVGRRITQNLYDGGSTGLFPYNDSNAMVSYVQGVGGVSALEFQSDNAQFYKPILYTDFSGNFKMRGSSANSDFFELGSAGTINNEGRLEFVIGDDGDEPITFQKYNYTTDEYIEMVRMQGVGLDSSVRVAIANKGEVANSTLQVNGSFSTAVREISTPLVLGESDHTIILNNNSAIILPSPDTAKGREYFIKKTDNRVSVISQYLDDKNVPRTSIGQGTYTFVSDGNNWHLLHADVLSSFSGILTIGTNTNIVSISNLPFRPSRIEFVAYANIDRLNLDDDNSVGNGNNATEGAGNNNNNGINNSFGYMTGFAQDNNGSVTQQVICGGGSASSINDISRYASSTRCIGVRYANNNGIRVGLTTASILSFDDSGFTLTVNDNDDALIVIYTAYR